MDLFRIVIWSLVWIIVGSFMWNEMRTEAAAASFVDIAQQSFPAQHAAHHVVTGTLDALDLESGKGVLKTDLGKPIFFETSRPDLFRNLSIGQRVTLGLDEQGQAIKVMEIPPEELPSPPFPSHETK